MGLLKQIKSKVLHKDEQYEVPTYSYPVRQRMRHDLTRQLPANVLEIIFRYVCPHSQDHTYLPSEQSPIGDGCMLCDLRDLSSCAQVSKKWSKIAQKVLYTSIRIDAVHYCILEEELASKRKKTKGHFKSKSHIDPGEVPGIRLALLCRTLRENSYLARHTRILKLPYMTRESCKADLARTISTLPNLHYVDLPDGFYTGDLSCQALREELQAHCPAVRKMVYRSGSEPYLEFILQRHWQQIMVLELSDVAIEPGVLQLVLASLPSLQDLTLSELPWLEDSIFEESLSYPPFVAVEVLKLSNTPNVTSEGLLNYLAVSHNKATLRSLSLHNTGVAMSDLHRVLWRASALEHLSINEAVSKSLLTNKDLPSLTSISLKVLSFEISNSEVSHGIQQPSESYYAYLAASLHASALPALTTLYVREQGFPERLVLLPMAGLKASSRTTNSLSVYAQSFPAQQSSFNQTLEVFSRGMDELEWVFTAVAPAANKSRDRFSTASIGRPLSAYSASRGLGPQWAQGGFGGEARKSVIVGNGFGGYLAVPSEEVPSSLTGGDTVAGAYDDTERSQYLQPPPSMSALTGNPKVVEKRGSKHDLWR